VWRRLPAFIGDLWRAAQQRIDELEKRFRASVAGNAFDFGSILHEHNGRQCRQPGAKTKLVQVDMVDIDEAQGRAS
jgi:hypothetical protein